MFKKPLTEFGGQSLFYRPIQILHIVFPRLELGDKVIIVCLSHRQFYIHAGPQRRISGLIHCLIKTLEPMLITDGTIICQNRSVESHLVAKDMGQHLFIGRRCTATRSAIARHDTTQITVFDGNLKWLSKLFDHFPVTHRYICTMDTASRLVKSHKMLGTGITTSAIVRVYMILYAPGIGCPHNAI